MSSIFWFSFQRWTSDTGYGDNRYSSRESVFSCTKRTPLPDGIALNKNGEPTNDAKKLWKNSATCWGPKGYALSLVIDIMAGILTGSNHGKGITSLYGDLENAQTSAISHY